MIVEQGRYLILQGKGISYILRIHEQGYLLHVYYGRKLRENDFPYFPSAPRSFYTFAPDQVFLEGESQEYPAFGYNDLKEGAVEVLADGKIARVYLVRKTVSDSFFTSVFLIRFAGGTDQQQREILHKIFLYLDGYPVEWQFSLFDYADYAFIHPEKINGSLVWSNTPKEKTLDGPA